MPRRKKEDILKQLALSNQKETVPVQENNEDRADLKPDIRLLNRYFLAINGVEFEVCQDPNTKRYYVRHHAYWYICHGSKNPDPVLNCVVKNLQTIADINLETLRWAGHKFEFINVEFEDGMQTETILLPLKMFEDFIFWHYQQIIKSWFKGEGDKGEPTDNKVILVCRGTKDKSLSEYLKEANENQ